MRFRPSLSLLLATALTLPGCAYEPGYSYQTVPCQPGADASVPPPPNAPAGEAPGAQPGPQLCMVPVPYAGAATAYNYRPYRDYGWPYYGYGIGFVGVGFHHFHHGSHGGHSHGSGHGAHHGGGGGSHGGGHR